MSLNEATAVADDSSEQHRRADEEVRKTLGAKQHRGLKCVRCESLAMQGFPGKFTLWSI